MSLVPGQVFATNGGRPDTDLLGSGREPQEEVTSPEVTPEAEEPEGGL